MVELFLQLSLFGPPATQYFPRYFVKDIAVAITVQKRARISEMLITYRCQLGRSSLGRSNLSTGVTLELIDSIVSRCHEIQSAENLFSEFEAFFRIISEICDE